MFFLIFEVSNISMDFGASWEPPGHLLGRHGASWARLGGVLARLGGILALLGGVLARLGGVLGASWRRFGSKTLPT